MGRLLRDGVRATARSRTIVSTCSCSGRAAERPRRPLGRRRLRRDRSVLRADLRRSDRGPAAAEGRRLPRRRDRQRRSGVARRARGRGVTGLDIAPGMLELARAKPGADAIRFDLGDARSLPYEDASFDIVASNFGVIFAPDQEVVASELARVTRPGGRLGLTAWCAKPELDEIYARFGRTSSIDSYVWSRPDELERLLGDAFDLELHERVWHLEGDSGERLRVLVEDGAADEGLPRTARRRDARSRSRSSRRVLGGLPRGRSRA